MNRPDIIAAYEIEDSWDIVPFEGVLELPMVQESVNVEKLEAAEICVSRKGEFFLFLEERHSARARNSPVFVAKVLPVTKREAYEILARALLPEVFHSSAGL